MMKIVKINLLLVFIALLFCSNITKAQDDQQWMSLPERTLKSFFVAIELKDEESLKRLVMPNPDLPVLWEGKKPSIKDLNMIYYRINNMYEFRAYEAGETFKYNGKEITVTDKMVNDNRALVARLIKGQTNPPWLLYFVKGSWRVDADNVINYYLSQKGQEPTSLKGDIWKNVANLESVLKSKAAIWFYRDKQFMNENTSPYFHWISDDKQTAYYPEEKGAAKVLSMFGLPLDEASISFSDSYLCRIEATFYERGRSKEELNKDAFNTKLKDISAKIDAFIGEKGVDIPLPEAFKKAKKVVDTKAWVLDDTYSIYLKWCYSKVRKKVKKKRKTVIRPEYIQVVIDEYDSTNDPRDIEDADGNQFVEVNEKVQGLLNQMGAGFSPYDNNFWEQNKVTFLGQFVDAYKLYWTTEMKRGVIEEFRSCYLKSIEPDTEDRNGFRCFIKNKPLVDANVRLFNIPIVAMTAAFMDGKLVKFSFDFWNKGDADIDSEYLSGKAREEKPAAKSMKDLINIFKKNGVKFTRGGSSKNKFTRIHDKRQVFRAGSSIIKFIEKRKEYYSVVIENVKYSTYEKMEFARKKQQRGKALRTMAKEKVIAVEKKDPKKPWCVKGDKYLDIPMVDQGAKGYCAPATVLRVVKYFGHDATMNELAALMDTQGGGGTLVRDVIKGVKKVSSKMKLRYKELKVISKKKINKEKDLNKWIDKYIIEYIDNGIPVYWCNKAHMRLVVGYNKETKELLMSDSWGNEGYNRYNYKQSAAETFMMFVTK